MSRLEVHEATVRYGDIRALDACSLTLEAGELVTVLGPSGCGKSTLLRVIAGLVAMDGGSVAIDGRDVTAEPPAGRDVAMVFQGYALFPHLDVASNIAFGMRARKVPVDVSRAAVEDIAGALGIDALLARRPHELSGGERQRVALARALVRSPKVALLDEPLASLDAPLRVSARGEIARLQRGRGTTMIHVTHDQAEAMALGHRVVVMRDGRVVQVGSPTEIYELPASTFVASFVGSPPMNLLEDRESGLILGVRPEHVRLGPEGSRAGVVEAIERLGDHLIVTLAAGSERILAKLPPDADVAAGRETRLSFQVQHRFDIATGLRIG